MLPVPQPHQPPYSLGAPADLSTGDWVKLWSGLITVAAGGIGLAMTQKPKYKTAQTVSAVALGGGLVLFAEGMTKFLS